MSQTGDLRTLYATALCLLVIALTTEAINSNESASASYGSQQGGTTASKHVESGSPATYQRPTVQPEAAARPSEFSLNFEVPRQTVPDTEAGLELASETEILPGGSTVQPFDTDVAQVVTSAPQQAADGLLQELGATKDLGNTTLTSAPLAAPGAPTEVPSTDAVREEEQDDEEDRHNFALAKDGAKVVAANKEAKKTGALLDSDGDTFLKNECKADKWVIIELSQVTQMDTLIISQNELYSSRVKEFEVRGRQTHPRVEGSEYSKTLNSSAWQLLGHFTAKNIKGSQAFKLERPTWLKYLQLRLLSHHGTEAVCALNDVCVYGKSAAEDLEARLNLESQEESLQSMADPSLQVAGEPPLQEDGSADGNDSSGIPTAEATAAAVQGVEAAASRLLNDSIRDAERAAGSTLVETEGHEDQTQREAELLPKLTKGSIDSLPEKPVLAPQPPGKPSEKEVSVPAVSEGPVSTKGAQVDKQGFPAPQDGGQDGSTGGGKQLPANSASSSASRHGGSVYDMIVQELKAIKLAQKASARTLTQLQKNVTSVMGGFAFELDLISSRLKHSDSRAAIMPPDTMEEEFCAAEGFGSNGTRISGGETLSPQPGSCQGNRTLPRKVIKPPTELEFLQLEVSALRQVVHQLKQQTDTMLLALAFSLLGGTGFGFILGSSSGRVLKGLLLAFASLPFCLVSLFWLIGESHTRRLSPSLGFKQL